MKTLIKFTIAFLLPIGLAFATDKVHPKFYHNQGPIIFIENNIEFAVFQDGQFDFNYLPNRRRYSYFNQHINITYNGGYNYTPHIRVNRYGSIIQIRNTPIFYDFYGRVTQIGQINLKYNRFGYLKRIGNMHIRYNRHFNRYYLNGFINRYNKGYTYRPWHRNFRRPKYAHHPDYRLPISDRRAKHPKYRKPRIKGNKGRTTNRYNYRAEKQKDLRRDAQTNRRHLNRRKAPSKNFREEIDNKPNTVRKRSYHQKRPLGASTRNNR